MEKIYGMHKLVGLQLFLSGTPTFSSGTPTFCQMGVLNSCFQNPSESSEAESWHLSMIKTEASTSQLTALGGTLDNCLCFLFPGAVCQEISKLGTMSRHL